MTKPPRKYDPPEATTGDHAHTLARAGISALPYVSGPAVELFNALIAPPLQKRQRTWMESIAEGLRALEEKQATVIDDLRENEAFIDTVLQASQAAVRTSQVEKRAALRNAVLNAALPDAPNETKQAMFLNWIESLTAWHLRLLRLLANAPQWFADAGRKPPEYHIAGSISQMISDAYPELRGNRDFLEKLFNDLVAEGLLSKSGLFTVMSGSGPFEKRSTSIGDEFLDFIADPT